MRNKIRRLNNAYTIIRGEMDYNKKFVKKVKINLLRIYIRRASFTDHSKEFSNLPLSLSLLRSHTYVHEELKTSTTPTYNILLILTLL